MATEQKKPTSRNPLVFGGQPSITLPTALYMTESMLPENWRMWKAKGRHFVTLAQLDTQPMAYQLAIFRHAVGDEARRVLEILELSEAGEEVEISEVLRRFWTFCEAQINKTYQKVFIFVCDRSPSESFETELKLLARN